MFRGVFAPNRSLIETPRSIEQRTQHLLPAFATLNKDLLREVAATATNYSTPQLLGGSRPPGLGFQFGDSWSRTQRGAMEFSFPVGQVDVINMSLRYAMENVFVGKALRLKTQLICKGIKNQSGNDKADSFLAQVNRELALDTIYRQAVWLYQSCGIAPIVLPDSDQPLEWAQVVDPRMVRTLSAFGKKFMYLIADSRMKAAANDPTGASDPRNRDYWESMPKSWRKQLSDPRNQNVGGEVLIKLEEGSYLLLENRYNPVDRRPNGFDGTPLQPYFAACEQYRMLMAGDFASAFLAKNLIALVSVGDPAAERDMYIRPDNPVLDGLQSVFQNPNQAQWIFGDPTLNVRYITPSKDAFDSAKYNEPKEQLKNLLPSPFWFNDGGGSFAAATVEMKQLQEEVDATNDHFDRDFWEPLYERACDGRAIAKKNRRAPSHDRNSLKDETQDLQNKASLYNNGGLDVESLMEAHGFDPEVVKARLRQQQKDAKSGIYMPAFEQKQNIVASKIYGLDKPAPGGAAKPGGKGGRPRKPASKPQSEATHTRTPRSKGK